MNYINDIRFLGGIIKISQYRNILQTITNKTHLNIKQKIPRENILRNALTTLTNISNEINVINT
jgi:hypothetical protein